MTANGAATYSWSTGATSSGVNTANASPVITTTYTVTGTSSGCSATASANVTVNCTVGIEEQNDNFNIVIAPNPFTTQTSITFSSEQTNTIIKIIDVLGKEIKSETFSGKQLIIEKGKMQSGVYFVQITDEKKNIVNRKIVVE